MIEFRSLLTTLEQVCKVKLLAVRSTNASFCYILPQSETASTTKIGWTVGGGLEDVLVGNWLAKIEFRYSDFGHFNHAFFPNTGGILGAPNNADQIDVSVRPQTYTFLASIGYKFNGTGSPMSQ